VDNLKMWIFFCSQVIPWITFLKSIQLIHNRSARSAAIVMKGNLQRLTFVFKNGLMLREILWINNPHREVQ